MTGVTQEELKLFNELRSGGIPINEDVVGGLKNARDELQIIQSPFPTDSGVFDQVLGATYFMLGITITNVSKWIIRVQAYRLKIPWSEANIRWLQYPLEEIPRDYSSAYWAFGCSAFGPEMLLNDRVGRKGTLYPGDCLDGRLLGAVEDSIPLEYDDRKRVTVELSIYDGQERCYDLQASLRIHRRKVILRKSSRRPGSLFSKRDEVKENQEARYRRLRAQERSNSKQQHDDLVERSALVEA